jgi:hypothetical protein
MTLTIVQWLWRRSDKQMEARAIVIEDVIFNCDRTHCNSSPANCMRGRGYSRIWIYLLYKCLLVHMILSYVMLFLYFSPFLSCKFCYKPTYYLLIKEIIFKCKPAYYNAHRSIFLDFFIGCHALFLIYCIYGEQFPQISICF